jgi:uncharacterized repeat protein (TIGR04138 family)
MSQAEAVSHCAACGQRKAVIDGIATRLGYPDTTVAWIAGAVLFAGTHERKGIGRMHVDAAELCRMLVADFDERDPVRIAVRLGDMGLASSRDIGRIVYALIEADQCQAGDNDRKDDFDAIFDRDTVDRYAAEVLGNRSRDWPVIAKQVAIFALVIAGLAIVEVGKRSQAFPSPVAIASSMFGIAWLLSLLRWPRPMRFGLPWNRLRRAGQRAMPGNAERMGK